MTSRGTGAGSIRAEAKDAVAISRGERRQHPRLYESFPVLVRGVDARGEAFERETVLDDFSAGGF